MAIVRIGPRQGEVGIFPGEGPSPIQFPKVPTKRKVPGIPLEERQRPTMRAGRQRTPPKEYVPPPPPKKSKRELEREEAWNDFKAEFDDNFGTKFAREQYERYGFGKPGSYTIDTNRQAIIDTTRQKPPILFSTWFIKWRREHR